jgi:hypothetical protein
MSEIQPIPCAELIERDPPECKLGRLVPQDCRECEHYAPGLNAQERQRCEIWTRVMGYCRPLSAWNPGKQQEHKDRKFFRESAVPSRYTLAEGEGHD